MELGQPPVPPQPPATAVETSAAGSVAIHRYFLGDQEVVVRITGNIGVTGDSTLDISGNGRVDVEILNPEQRTTIIWDSSGCTVYRRSATFACDATEREFVVSNVKQQPTPPIPPRLQR